MARRLRRERSDDVLPPVWDDLDRRGRQRLVAASAIRLAVAVAGLLVVYAAVPVDGRSSLTTLAVMTFGAVAFLVAISLQFRRLLHSPYPSLRAVQTIVVVVLVFLVGFALSYATMSAVEPSNFSEPLDRLDAFYFTVTVAATVGFGDITATSSLARLIVTIQMVVGLALVGVLVRVVVGIAERRRAEVRTAGRSDN